VVRPSTAPAREQVKPSVSLVVEPPTVLTPAPVVAPATADSQISPKIFALKPVAAAASQAPSTQGAIASEVVTKQQAEVVPEPQAAVEPEPQAEVVPEPEVSSDAISPFEISATLTLEPQTNSIVISEIPDAIRMGDIVTDAGLILRTGSIEIVPVSTGQIDIIPESTESDVAESIDSASSFVPSLAPVRASGVLNSQSQVGALPVRRRRFIDATVTSVTLGIVILALAAAGVISFMLGILR